MMILNTKSKSSQSYVDSKTGFIAYFSNVIKEKKEVETV